MRVKMLLVPLVASAALLAACTPSGPAAEPTPTTNGVEGKSAEEIMAAAADAMADAESFRLAGTIGESPLSFDLDLTFASDDVQGTVNLLGVEVNVIKKGATLYVNADASFWISTLEQFLADATPEQLSALGDQLRDGWASAPAALAGPVVPVPLAVDDLLSEDMVPAPLTKGEQTTLDGTPVITVTDADGAIYSIAIVGEPYLLQVESPDGEPITFSDFNEPVTIDEPEDALDLLSLLGLG